MLTVLNQVSKCFGKAAIAHDQSLFSRHVTKSEDRSHVYDANKNNPVNLDAQRNPETRKSKSKAKADDGLETRGTEENISSISPDQISSWATERIAVAHRSFSNTTSSSQYKSKTVETGYHDDWPEVTQTEERRRIQNRVAQRKFRERALTQREKAQRDAINQQYAASSYMAPADEDVVDGNLSGLPWGGLNIHHLAARVHSAATHSAPRHEDGPAD
ncbi:hypothetical protein B0H63DRAFT_483885 [Podospora didyma]|uniref:BZIP domain-containing protein n=1 Tax=Podospora didyma TaxID=330526 RepID=A0AAE0K9V0_9PEZI|nr:hypothetical protein B0H63DRAFT_483885 [Podospora didyma]